MLVIVVRSKSQIRREKLLKRSEVAIRGVVEESSSDEEDDNHDGWASSLSQAEETKEAKLRNVDTSENLLESERVAMPFRIDFRLYGIQQHVPIADVEDSEAYGGKAKDEGSDARVGNS